MAGGKNVATDDPEVRKAADFAVGQLAGQSNSLVPPKLEEVRAVTAPFCVWPASVSIPCY